MHLLADEKGLAIQSFLVGPPIYAAITPFIVTPRNVGTILSPFNVISIGSAKDMKIHRDEHRHPLYNTVLSLPNVLSTEECEMLRCSAKRIKDECPDDTLDRGFGLTEVPTCVIDKKAQNLVNQMLRQRVLQQIQHYLPDLTAYLKRNLSVSDARISLESQQLEFNPNEPAVNINPPGGIFPKHTDGCDITVLILLSKPDSFVGGGTRFWPQNIATKNNSGYEFADAKQSSSDIDSKLLLAPQGTALIWSGDIYHSGSPTKSGERCIKKNIFPKYIFVSALNILSKNENDVVEDFGLKESLLQFMQDRPGDTGLIALSKIAFTETEKQLLKERKNTSPLN